LKQFALSSIALLLVVTSGVAQDVRYNFADAQFKNFKIYKWVEIRDAQKVDEPKKANQKSARRGTCEETSDQDRC